MGWKFGVVICGGQVWYISEVFGGVGNVLFFDCGCDICIQIYINIFMICGFFCIQYFNKKFIEMVYSRKQIIKEQ